jgi:hypothetical protein
MINILHFVLVLFMLNEIFFIFNRKRLDINFENKDVLSVKTIDLLHYITRVMSFIWTILLFITGYKLVASIFVILVLLKFLLYHLNENIYRVYVVILPIIYVIFYFSVFYMHLIR